MNPATMTEAELLSHVLKTLAVYPTVLYHHCRDSRQCDGQRGLPDLVLAGPHGVLFRELKTQDGESSPAQDLWAWTLTQPVRGRHVIIPAWRIWQPADLAAGMIDYEIQAIAQR